MSLWLKLLRKSFHFLFKHLDKLLILLYFLHCTILFLNFLLNLRLELLDSLDNNHLFLLKLQLSFLRLPLIPCDFLLHLVLLLSELLIVEIEPLHLLGHTL